MAVAAGLEPGDDRCGRPSGAGAAAACDPVRSRPLPTRTASCACQCSAPCLLRLPVPSPGVRDPAPAAAWPRALQLYPGSWQSQNPYPGTGYPGTRSDPVDSCMAYPAICYARRHFQQLTNALPGLVARNPRHTRQGHPTLCIGA
eukprot:3501913-Rhodomonas_salina.1